jgi:hypothetical protein
MLLTIAFACFIIQVVCWLLLPSSAQPAYADSSEAEAAPDGTEAEAVAA